MSYYDAVSTNSNNIECALDGYRRMYDVHMGGKWSLPTAYFDHQTCTAPQIHFRCKALPVARAPNAPF
jgi:hypothetical protein